MQQKEKAPPPFRCKKNTWHVESNYVLQREKYLTSIVNRLDT